MLILCTLLLDLRTCSYPWEPLIREYPNLVVTQAPPLPGEQVSNPSSRDHCMGGPLYGLINSIVNIGMT